MSYAHLSPPYIWYLCVCARICLAFGNEFIVTELLFAMRLFLSIAWLPSSERARFQRALQTEKSLFLFLRFFGELPGSPSEALAFPTFFQLSDDINGGASIKCWLSVILLLNILKLLLFFSYYGWVNFFREAKVVNPFIYTPRLLFWNWKSGRRMGWG